MKTLAAAVVLFACNLQVAPAGLAAELEKKWPENRTINFVFHGHSVPAGYQKTPDVRTFEAYPHLFAVAVKAAYPHAVINSIVTAVGGENSIRGAARFKRDVLKHDPDLVFIDYALNDRRKPPAEVEAAWRAMIGIAKEAGVPVILCTPTGDLREDLSDPANPLRVLADMIRRLGREENVPVADVSAAWADEVTAKGTPQEQLLSQPNHPNLRGNQLAANALFRAFIDATKEP